MRRTSTQEPQVMPSIRSSHFSVNPVDFPKGSFSMSGSSTFPEPEEIEPLLYQKVGVNADIDAW